MLTEGVEFSNFEPQTVIYGILFRAEESSRLYLSARHIQLGKTFNREIFVTQNTGRSKKPTTALILKID